MILQVVVLMVMWREWSNPQPVAHHLVAIPYSPITTQDHPVIAKTNTKHILFKVQRVPIQKKLNKHLHN